MIRVLTSVLVLSVLYPNTLTAQDLLLDNAWIVNPRDQSVTRGSLLISDGRIVGPSTGVPDGFQGRIIDLSGKWVIPSLNDMHTHSFGNMAPGSPPDFPGTPCHCQAISVRWCDGIPRPVCSRGRDTWST